MGGLDSETARRSEHLREAALATGRCECEMGAVSDAGGATMIVFHPERCTGCGLCAKVCHNRCIVLVDGKPMTQPVLCDGCSQCIAICAQQARSWAGVPPVSYEEQRLPSTSQLEELYKQRRSIRFFKRHRIDRNLLQAVVQCSAYAPTNNHELRLVVADGLEDMWDLEQVAIRFSSRIYRLLFQPRMVFALLDRLSTAVTRQVRAKLEARHSDRLAPAAMVFVVGDPRIAFSEASAQAALDLITLRAQTEGIGGCLWGVGKIALNRSRAARRHLGLQRDERILGVLLLGYPDVRFRNKVEGKRMPIRWMGGRDQRSMSREEGA